MHRRPRGEGRELFQALEGLEEHMRRAVAPHRVERHEDPPIGPQLEAILGKGRAEERAAQRLPARPIGGGDPDTGGFEAAPR